MANRARKRSNIIRSQHDIKAAIVTHHDIRERDVLRYNIWDAM